MSKTHIRFAADILRRLGEELNPNPDQGIIELVKNSYDADARRCTVELINTDQPGGTVRITDNGDGMDSEAIEMGWLVLGKSPKNVRERTRLGRIPAGSKGLGRLAALRMGSRTTLATWPRSDPNAQFNLIINWNEYENIDLVDDVELEIVRNKRKKDQNNGSEILLEDLHSSISRLEGKRLARAMILLADPFGDDPGGFEPLLVSLEFSDLEALVRNRYFGEADYHLISELDESGRSAASVKDWRGKELFSADHKELSSGRSHREYASTPARFDFWVFILNAATFSTRKTTIGEVRAWLGEFGGVHVYENDLRVNPYGNPGNDWLDINLRRAQNPEERPSTNTSIGRISVTDIDEVLLQKTDRSGFIENEAFLGLKEFAQDSLEWMARRRLDIAEKRRAEKRAVTRTRSTRSQRNLEKAIESAPKNVQPGLRKAYGAYERSRDQEVKSLRKEVQLYRTLSTAGITTATIAHETSGSPIKVITQSIKAVERRAKKALNDRYSALKKPVDSIKNAVSALGVLGSVTLNLLDHEKRRVGRVEIHEVIENVLDIFEPFLRGRDVDVEKDLASGNPFLRGSDAAIESIITNLLNNSLAAFEVVSTRKRKILIRTEIAEELLTLRVLDNGPGIQGISLRDIWLPGQTTRTNGTGLGLTIVRDAVTDLGGKTNAKANGELGGAEIIIELPILGS